MEDTKDHHSHTSSPVEDKTATTKMPIGFSQLLSETWELLQKKFWSLFGVNLIMMAVIAITVGLAVLVSLSLMILFSMFRLPVLTAVITMVLLTGIGVLTLWLNTWQVTATILSLHSTEHKSVKVLLESARPVAGKLLPLAILSFLVIVGGLVLFIVPGIILGVLLTFIYVIAVIEHKSPWEAMQASAELVRGRWWNVCLMLVGLAVLVMVILMISGWYLSPLWLLVGPLAYAFTYVMYRHLHQNPATSDSYNISLFKLFAVFGAVAMFMTIVIFSASGGTTPKPLLYKWLNKNQTCPMMQDQNHYRFHQSMIENPPLQLWEWQQQPGWQTNEPSWNPLQDNNQFMRYQILYK